MCETQVMLDKYFLPRELLAKSKKADGKEYATYRAWVKPEYWKQGKAVCCIIKELPRNQADIYRKLSETEHSNLEKIYRVIDTLQGAISISEYVEGTVTLEEWVLQGDWEQNREKKIVLDILLQLCEGLEQLHRIGLIHGDIHPANILLKKNELYETGKNAQPRFGVKLIDFDNTQIPKDAGHNVTHLMGTKPFAAPEILDFSHPLDRADFYSLGCIFYYMLRGNSPKDENIVVPVKNAILDRQMRHIFLKCTASYEARYANAKELKRDILLAKKLEENRIQNCFRHIPGFRTHTLWKMLIASYVYLAMLLSCGIDICLFVKNGLRINAAVGDSVWINFIILLEILVICDAFRIGEHFKKYWYFRNAHPFLRLVLKGVVSLLLFWGLSGVFW